jgi:putative transposase
MNEGKKFRVYPTKEQIKTLSQWIGHQRFIYNSKVGEDRYFRKFKNKSLSLIGEDVPCDQKYSQFISADTDFLKDVPSQILRNGVYGWRSAYQLFFKKLSGRPTIKKKHGRQSVMITKELFTFYSVDPKTAMINLGTKKHPIGPI